MKPIQMFAMIAVAAAFGSIGCNKVEGTYRLDKEQMRKETLAKTPQNAEEERSQKMFLAILEDFNLRLTLEPGGTVTSHVTFGETDEGPKKGSWKSEDGFVVIQFDDKGMKCKKNGKNQLTCSSDGSDALNEVPLVKVDE